MPGNRHDILRPLAQGGDSHGKDIESVIKVFAKHAPGNRLGHVTIGGRDNANIQRHRLLAADPLHLTFLQHAQQFALQIQGDFADFIQKERAAIGQLKPAYAVTNGSGERAAHVAKKFAFKQIARNRSAIDFDQGASRALAAFVNGARNQFFAGAGFAQNQHVGFTLGNQRNLIQHFFQRQTFADNVAEQSLLFDFFAQVIVFQPKLFA